jgi:hypothetical protein
LRLPAPRRRQRFRRAIKVESLSRGGAGSDVGYQRDNCRLGNALLNIKHEFSSFKYENSCFLPCRASQKIFARISCRAYNGELQIDDTSQALTPLIGGATHKSEWGG